MQCKKRVVVMIAYRRGWFGFCSKASSRTAKAQNLYIHQIVIDYRPLAGRPTWHVRVGVALLPIVQGLFVALERLPIAVVNTGIAAALATFPQFGFSWRFGFYIVIC